MQDRDFMDIKIDARMRVKIFEKKLRDEVKNNEALMNLKKIECVSSSIIKRNINKHTYKNYLKMLLI